MKKVLSAIIVDDEAHCRTSLAKQIEWSCPDIRVIANADSVKTAIVAINKLQPDIVFLDIEMPGGSGFDLIEKMNEINFHVIFTTAYDAYALKAFQVHATAYLLKPVDADELEKAVKKLRESQSSENSDEIKNLIEHIKGQSSTIKKVALPVSSGLEFVPIDDIIRCASDGSYCEVHLLSGKKLLISKTLKQVEELIATEKFIRIHHSHLINQDYVKSYIKGKGGQVVLDDGTTIPVSRSRRDTFLKRF